MKKSIVALIAAVALAVFAVPAVAFAQAAPPMQLANGGATSFAHHTLHSASKGEVAACIGSAIATVRSACAAGHGSVDGNHLGYIDQDGDGVCDNYAAGSNGCSGYVDENGDGICDACENGQDACPGYNDVDNNGICDNYGSGSCGQGYGAGNGAGYGHYGHHGNAGGHRGCMNR